ncbi:hypothetical protein KP509_03G033900 [Ceratopteris richardii]|uniref:SS18 N-terminal domain-containing protein n=1 Tax=Ceratopteris richardii TaxID=49495 RepID=A0A8T2V626_CERRI|nr:hypothetical protein KP509_03G033900 [Ceratopteris richardii]
MEGTEKYLDENKQLILAILDNQNLGKMNECAVYQARLQSNLMYLAAIADSQPQTPSFPSQMNPPAAMPGGLHYMAHQQTQQQIVQQQALLAARNSMQYTQAPLSMHHSVAAQHHQQQQQALAAHHGLNPAGHHSMAGLPSGSSLGGGNGLGSGSFPEFGRGGSSVEDLQVRSMGDMRGSSRQDSGLGVNVGSASGHPSEEPEASYLKASEEEGN